MSYRVAPYSVSIGSTEKEYVMRALEYGHLTLNTSELIAEYESNLSKYFDAGYCVAFSSGTAAIHAALIALGVGPGSQVILPPTAPVMSVLPVLHQNATPVFADTKPGLFDLDPDSVRAACNSKTAAILSVPMWGYPTNDLEIRHISDSLGIPIVIDAAQAHGSMSGSKLCGTDGIIGCFSTYESKLIGTGEGGFAITSDKNLSRVMREARNFGSPYRAGRHWPGATLIGWNYKPTTLTAALGLAQLESLEHRINLRAKIRQTLESKINHPMVRFHPIRETDRHNGYAIVLHLLHHDKRVRNSVMRSMVDSGVPSDTVRYGYRALYRHSLLTQGYGTIKCPFDCALSQAVESANCPNAEETIAAVTTIPCHESLTKKDIDYISCVVSHAFKGVAQ